MEQWVVVDGYNVINAWPALLARQQLNLQAARDDLLERLADYQGYWGGRVLVVFDAHLVKGSLEKRERWVGIEVVYTREGETADNYIERTVARLADGRNQVRVATSDALEQVMILARGASRISAREFIAEVERVRGAGQKQHRQARALKPNALENQLNADVRRRLDGIRRKE